MIGVEVRYGMIPLVPVHVDHHTIEGADPRHGTTIAEATPSSKRAVPVRSDTFEPWPMTC
jgi:hypothetical protein